MSKRKNSSTPNSDSIIKDNSWICVFCQQRSHYRGMGDLFGPYYISVEVKQEGAGAVGAGVGVGSTSEFNNQQSNQSTGPQREVWFHEDCLVWSNGVYLVGHKIRNIEEVIKDCSENICFECKLKGAPLGCLHKGCSPRYHYLCAKEKGNYN